MAVRAGVWAVPRVVDRAWLRRRLADAKGDGSLTDGFVPTAAQVREMMLADGIRPEDNAFSSELLHMRYEEA